jgi:hypothetical protein
MTDPATKSAVVTRRRRFAAAEDRRPAGAWRGGAWSLTRGSLRQGSSMPARPVQQLGNRWVQA